MHLASESSSMPEANLVGAGNLVPFCLEYFDKDDAKIFRGDVYQTNTSIIGVYLLVPPLEKREKSLAWTHSVDNSM